MNKSYFKKKLIDPKGIFLLRKLKAFDVSQRILQLVYSGLIHSILSFNIIVWYGNISSKNTRKLARVVNTASKLSSILCNAALKRKATQKLYERKVS